MTAFAAAVSASITNDRVEFELGEIIPVRQTLSLTLVLSIFKFDRMEWAIEKCVELGAIRIVPVVAERTESHLAKAAQKRVERWQRIALQASEQSRRASRAGNPAACSPQGGPDDGRPARALCWPNPKNR